MPIPVVDLFAGPGGLGEGFAAYGSNASRGHVAAKVPGAFRIALSIEKDPLAHQTLELRAFFRQFPDGQAPAAYYDHLRHATAASRAQLFAAYPDQARLAREEAWHAELGVIPNDEIDRRIRAALKSAEPWILVGGPPCQAFSVVGRARRGGITRGDARVHLYREYLRILAVHRPPVFVMENVTGLLSSRLDGASIFETMLDDLRAPETAVGGPRARKPVTYEMHSFVRAPRTSPGDGTPSPRDYVIRSEQYGLPQARHRVILLGVRSDVACQTRPQLCESPGVATAGVLEGLPRLRSGLSRQPDTKAKLP